jgi:hypothetical protein
LAGRSRKRGRREKPAAVTAAPQSSSSPETTSHATAIAERYEDRNAAVRATLEPLAPGERPAAITVSAVLAAMSGVGNLIAYLAGAKIAGKHPAVSGIIGFSGLMLILAFGLWRMRQWAVLLFMALLVVITCLFTLLLLKASNLLGFLVPPVIIAGSGYLFWKLVRTLSRIQMPKQSVR